MDQVFRGEHTVSRQRIAIFSDVIVNPEGWIESIHKDVATLNRGCLSSDFVSSRHRVLELPHFPEVISIAEFWGSETWHIVGEALAGLAFFTDSQVSVIERAELH